MKRNIHFLFLLSFAACFNSSSFASTNVPPTVAGDVQWDAAGNPYVIQGKVVVPKDSTLRIGPNVKLVFQGASALEVDGHLEVLASAAAPAVIDMTQGGLGSELFLNGADAKILNTKILSGVFLAQNSNLHLEWFEITKGSGLYLRGTTSALIKDGKIYGNATGVVLDGQVSANLEFNTITQNTYGLYLKNYSNLVFKNNSVHDNDKEVINNTPTLNLAGNYWGTDNADTVAAKVQGPVNLGPMSSLKDILREYIKTQLPVITREMSLAQVKKEKREAVETARKEKEVKRMLARAKANGIPAAAVAAVPSTAPAGSQPAVEATSGAPEEASTTPEQPVEAASVEEAAPSAPAQTVEVKQLEPAPHSLQPLGDLPPQLGTSGPSAVVETQPETAPAAPAPATTENAAAPSAAPEAAPAPPAPASAEVPAPPAAESAATPAPSNGEIPLPPSTTTGTELPPVPEASTTAPPAVPSASENAPPVPPEVSGTSSAATQAPAASSAAPALPAPPAAEVVNPPDIETSTAPSVPAGAAPATTNASTTSNQESVPSPPDLNEQVPSPPAAASSTGSSSTASSNSELPPVPGEAASPSAAPPAVPEVSSPSTAAPPVPPSSASEAGSTSSPQSNPPPVPPAAASSAQPSESDQKAGVQALDGVNGDIDGMQAPPLDLGIDTNGSPTTSTPSGSTSAPASQNSSNSGVILPPIKDSDVAPPKDLDLPPTDDLGNVNLDSKNK